MVEVGTRSGGKWVRGTTWGRMLWLGDEGCHVLTPFQNLADGRQIIFLPPPSLPPSLCIDLLGLRVCTLCSEEVKKPD